MQSNYPENISRKPIQLQTHQGCKCFELPGAAVPKGLMESSLLRLLPGAVVHIGGDQCGGEEQGWASLPAVLLPPDQLHKLRPCGSWLDAQILQATSGARE